MLCITCKGLCNAKCSLGKLLKLEDTHGSIPDYSLAVCQGPLESLETVRSNIETLHNKPIFKISCLIKGCNL